MLPYPLYRGFLDLADESPEPATDLEPAELPDDTGNGPHFFYGLQWWFFGALADLRLLLPGLGRGPGSVGSKRAARARQSDRSMPPSTGSITPVTKDEAGLSRKAAAAANSSGRP